MLIKTDIGNTRENANRIRFEQTASITATNVQDAIEQVAITPQALQPTPVGAGDSPYTPAQTDTYLAVDTSAGPVTINLAPSVSRLGVPLPIKDITGNADSNPVTINAASGEDIDGFSSIEINAAYGGFKLDPKADGYSVSP